MKDAITDFRIRRTLNMLHYATEQVNNIRNSLHSNKTYTEINQDTAIEFYIISFSQIIYILHETMNEIHGKNNNLIKFIFEIKKINDWHIFAQQIKHNNVSPQKTQNIDVLCSQDAKGSIKSTKVVPKPERHQFKFQKGRTNIDIDNMEEQMKEVHRILVDEIKKFYISKSK
ncbi:MAG: hypothetical protein PHU51_02610 [Candidatus Nanoarchaeia archaeon]|nr:hypothetical protein [Candidatus Nanoarchaeia archaeon]